jgi:phosphoribosylamine-glycine ligase
MVLAGGNDQIALIEELRRYFNNEVYIILVDMSSNVKAVPFADKFLQISTMDREAVLVAARAENIDYILTACGDQPLSTMAYVSARMGLPCYLTEEQVQLLTNKLHMKRMMIENGIPTSKYVAIGREWSLSDFKHLNYPLVVKPVDSNGSKGVKKVESADDIQKYLDEAFGYSLSGDVIVEEFNEGSELSIDVYVEGNSAKILSVISLEKIKQNKDSFTIVQSNYPPICEYDSEEIKRVVQQIVDVFGLKDTPLLIQAIQTTRGLRVVEFSARMGGGSKFRSIKTFSGVDIMNVYVRMVMGEKPSVNPQRLVNNASMSFVYCTPGVFSKICGFDELVAQGVIKYYYTYKMPGCEIVKSNTSSDRVAGFMIVGDSLQEVKQKIEYANSRLKVLDENGNDIMNHNLY